MTPSAILERRLQTAYLNVFGNGESRTEDQKLVWRDIESFCRAYRLSVESDNTGEYLENNLLVNEGRRSYWLRARGQIIAGLLPEPQPVKISRKRKPIQP